MISTARAPRRLRGPQQQLPCCPQPPRRGPSLQLPQLAGPEHRLWLPPLAHAEASRLGEELSTSVSHAKEQKGHQPLLITRLHAPLTPVLSLDKLPNLIKGFSPVPPLLMLGILGLGSTGGNT